MLSPIKMTPAYRYGAQTPWGGDGLRAWGKDIPDPRTGESLEVSALPGLESKNEAGETLTALLARYGAALAGTKGSEPFPLLLKLIHADDLLSVQVHPNDAYAAAHEGGKLGKSEAWVILEAEPGAQIVYGLREGVTREQLAEACRAGGEAVQACLHRVNVRPGEVYNIPAGMIHALGGGITLLEIQQSSDVTYRFYDWDRRDAAGRSRELHIAKALDVADTTLHLPPCAGKTRAVEGGEQTRYIDGPAFTLERWRAHGRMPLPATPEHIRLLFSLGEGRLTCADGETPLCRGDAVLLPAETAAALEGEVEMIACW